MRNKTLFISTAMLFTASFLGTGAYAQETMPDEAVAEESLLDLEFETEAETEGETEPAYDASEYVVLGDYIGLEVTVPPVEEITQEEIDERITNELVYSGAYEATDKTEVEEGDLVNIDYEGTIDGESFIGGEDEGYRLEVGSGDFLPEFETALIGHKVGETVTISATFPEDYYENVAGKEALFTVKINSIDELATVTDDNVSEITYGEFLTAKDYFDHIKAEIEDSREEEREYYLQSAITEKLHELCTVTGYPEDVLAYRIRSANEYHLEYAQALDMTMEEYASNYFSMSEEEFLDYVEEEETHTLEDDMIIHAIIDAEGMTLSEEEYQEALAGYAKDAWYDHPEDLEADYGADTLREYALLDKAMQFLTDNAVVTEDPDYFDGIEEDLTEVALAD